MNERGPLFHRLHRRLGSGVRWDVFWHEVRAGHFQLAFCVLFLPHGYALTKGDQDD